LDDGGEHLIRITGRSPDRGEDLAGGGELVGQGRELPLELLLLHPGSGAPSERSPAHRSLPHPDPQAAPVQSPAERRGEQSLSGSRTTVSTLTKCGSRLEGTAKFIADAARGRQRPPSGARHL